MVFYDSEDSWSGNFSLYLERSELQIWNTNKIEVMFTIPFWSNHWFHYILAASENSWCFIQYVSSVIGVQKDQIWDLIIYVSASPSRVRTWILCSKEKKNHIYIYLNWKLIPSDIREMDMEIVYEYNRCMIKKNERKCA